MKLDCYDFCMWSMGFKKINRMKEQQLIYEYLKESYYER